jgi:hypothetical protein
MGRDLYETRLGLVPSECCLSVSALSGVIGR